MDFGELPRPRLERLWVDTPFVRVPLLNRGPKSVVCPFPVQKAAARGHRFERSAAAQRNDRFSARQSFDRGDAEVFFSRHDERPAARVQFSKLRIAHPSAELDAGT